MLQKVQLPVAFGFLQSDLPKNCPTPADLIEDVGDCRLHRF